MTIQFIAPEGCGRLKKGVTYVMLRNDSILKRVLFVSFHDKDKKHGRHAELTIMHRGLFEQGLVSRNSNGTTAITPVVRPATLPPWLRNLEGLSFDVMDKYMLPKGGRKLSPKEEVEQRLLNIQPALKDVANILLADDPDVALNRIAASCEPRQHETRFRLWFYLYLAYGYSEWTLMAPRTIQGKWDRLSDAYKGSDVGRVAGHLSEQFRFRTTTDMIEKILSGFRKYAKKCDNLTEAWAMTVRLDFGGTIERVNGKYVVVPRKNKDGSLPERHEHPMPSWDKFYYYVHSRIGSDEIRRVMLGDTRHRNEERADHGSLTADLANIGERSYFDSRQVPDYPKSYVGNFPLPALHVVDLIDGATGVIRAPGFSLGSETGRAYCLSLFIAAVNNEDLTRIFGFEINLPGVGLPAALVSDRGAGASDMVRKALEQWSVAVEMAPSYDPKSDGVAESKHPRTKRQQGAPSVKYSNHTVIGLMKREFARIELKNRADDALSRASDRAVVEGNVKTPAELFNYLDANHRSSLINISLQFAVRAFLPSVTFKVKKGRVYLGHRQYSAKALFEPSVAKLLLRNNDLTISGYVIPELPRVGWLQINGLLIEVESVKDGADTAHLASLVEREAIAEVRSSASGERQAQKRVDVIAAQEAVREITGKEWHSGYSTKGRAKVKTAAALDEARRITQPG